MAVKAGTKNGAPGEIRTPDRLVRRPSVHYKSSIKTTCCNDIDELSPTLPSLVNNHLAIITGANLVQACQSTHRNLLDLAREIGGIVDMASWASDLLALDIERTGRRVGDLTIDELLSLLRARREDLDHCLKTTTAADGGVIS